MKPTLEEVKEKFKDAEKIISTWGTEGIIKNKFPFHYDKKNYAFYANEGELELWHSEKGYAKILTYKEQKFEITKEQIFTANNAGFLRIKEWFPEVFKNDLEVGKWYKNPQAGSIAFCEEILDKVSFLGFGFGNNCSNNKWFNKSDVEFTSYKWQEATPQEVETALKNEWIKRGGKNGVSIISTSGVIGLVNGGVWIFDKSFNKLYYGGYVIFDNGKWATIIETITIQEAEKLLNKKIVG